MASKPRSGSFLPKDTFNALHSPVGELLRLPVLLREKYGTERLRNLSNVTLLARSCLGPSLSHSKVGDTHQPARCLGERTINNSHRKQTLLGAVPVTSDNDRGLIEGTTASEWANPGRLHRGGGM